MTTTGKPLHAERVACEVCMKEVPVSEATVSEATDYVAYFCGLACYDKWKKQHDKPDRPAATPGP